MRKSIKKIVASVVAGAMALAMMVTPSVDAYAADGDWVLIGANDIFGAWNGDNAADMTDKGDGTFTYTFDTAAGTCYEFKAVNVGNGAASFWDNPSIGKDGGNMAFFAREASSTTITVDTSGNTLTWAANDGKNIEPNPAEKYQVVGSMNGWDPANGTEMTANDDGTYTATFDELAGNKYEFKIVRDGAVYGWFYQWADSNNDGANFANADGIAWDWEKLVITFNPTDGTVTTTATEVVKESESTSEETTTVPEGATTVTVHVATDWLKPNIWAFATENTEVNFTGGAWPGTALQANADNAGYYSTKLVLEEAQGITVIINGTDATTTDSVQTVNIDLAVVEGANEYWLTLGDLAAEPDEFGNVNYTATAVTTAPEGWVAGEVEELTTQATTTAPEGEENEEETTTAPDASAWDDALLKIHFLNSMEWEKVGVYLTYASWAELTGGWPGSEMQLEDGSETWYAVCTNADAEEAYNVIFNNMVSDTEANAGEAQKEQTPDTKDLAPGEYWFVLGDVTAESDTQITYAVTMFDSVEALEEAGYEYDGNGLVGDVAVDDPTEDETDAEAEDETTAAEDEKADGATTGDAAPVAVVLLGMVAAVAVVASKKRQNA